MNAHTGFFTQGINPTIAQYVPRANNSWATRYDEAKKMWWWWWWSRVYHWLFTWGASGYLVAITELVCLKLVISSSPIGIPLMLRTTVISA
jgi:hypothetical protein